MKLLKSIFSVIFLLTLNVDRVDGQVSDHTLNWVSPQTLQLPETGMMERLNFEGAVYDDYAPLVPFFKKTIPLHDDLTDIRLNISNLAFEPLSNAELLLLGNLPAITSNIEANGHLAFSRQLPVAIVTLLPFRLNPLTGKYEKLLSFSLEIIGGKNTTKSSRENNYAENSVLATGNWYKIRIKNSGIYKVTYSDMAAMGIDVTNLNSSGIRLYGNGGGTLPELNSVTRPDDLQENSIEMVDGGDGKFDTGDYFLFYGKSPDTWKFDNGLQIFVHERNIYDDYAYYFITTGGGNGKRIITISGTGLTPNNIVTKFNDYAFYELDKVNLIKSGREWYGELFDIQTSYDFSFSFPNIDAGSDHTLRMKVVAKSPSSSSFVAKINNQQDPLSLIIPNVSEDPNGYYARTVSGQKTFISSSPDILVNLKYNKTSTASTGWLDYLELNVIRNLTFSGSMMHFRALTSVGADTISEFRISGAVQGLKVWEVTESFNVSQVQTINEGSLARFTLPTSSLREFIAFDGTGFLTAEFVEQVPNQDLHSIKNVDYIIVSHPDFLEQANRLAVFHRSESGLTVQVTTPGEIYNEFSSGGQDITAIRDFMRMLYEVSDDGMKPKYLLLFGDASYDFKDFQTENSNFIPTYQSVESLHYISSFATDDFYGYLDPGEGSGSNELLDIGIGRFIVRTPDEAINAVDKVVHYHTSSQCQGPWRNVITFVADDENGNVHLNQADQLATFIDTTYKSYTIDKIYLDSYPQISTPGGQRYPGVNEAINSRIEKGSLIMNYTGHGGEVGWAHERVLEISDINSWTNWDMLSVFITATCEFTRYDDPNRISAGEYVFLNPSGGGIALFTTSRATFGGSNYSLNKGFYKYAFEKNDGQYHTMGDLIRLSKLESTSESNDKKFILLGDPALKLAYPKYNIETIAINNNEFMEVPDTLKALSNVSIEGKITDQNGTLIPDFDGTIYPVVFDKESEITTLGQDAGSSERTFKLRKNIIYKGKAHVEKGKFSFSFIVPKDIAYQFGMGKISYYADNGIYDASGYKDNVVIGGFDNVLSGDTNGPEMEIYLNDTLFRPGHITDPNPSLLIYVYDESGINTVGNGIGHDATAILDDDTENPYILNDYYETELDSYQYGVLRFPFFGLSPGEHEIKVKMWDVYNNSSEAKINFVVAGKESMVISDLKNYPNPFSSGTWFIFNHNMPDSELNIEIRIFDLSGRLVSVLDQQNINGGYFSTPLYWDGSGIGGALLGGGIYLYHVTATDAEGRRADAVKKLVITR